MRFVGFLSFSGRSIRLLVLLVMCWVLSLVTSQGASAQTEQGTINVNAIVAGPPPTTAPTINQPSDNATLDTRTITVSGDCIAGLVVKIFRNNIFAGSTFCTSGGTYSLPIDLFVARNDLIARQYDSLNRPSPDSETVTVYYIPPKDDDDGELPTKPDKPKPSGPSVAYFQLILNYDYTVQAVFAGQTVRVPIEFSGGAAPYAISVDWGDGESDVYSRPNTTLFLSEHVYEKAGNYIVKLRVKDSQGREAYLQFVLVVNGTDIYIATPFGPLQRRDWEIYFVIFFLVTAVIFFALGVWFERRALKRYIAKLEQEIVDDPNKKA